MENNEANRYFCLMQFWDISCDMSYLDERASKTQYLLERLVLYWFRLSCVFKYYQFFQNLYQAPSADMNNVTVIFVCYLFNDNCFVVGVHEMWTMTINLFRFVADILKRVVNIMVNIDFKSLFNLSRSILYPISTNVKYIRNAQNA